MTETTLSTTAAAVAEFLGLEFTGPDVEIFGPAPVDELTAGSLAFARHESKLASVSIRTGAAIICTSIVANSELTFIISQAPRTDFAKAVARFFPAPVHPIGIHPSALVDEMAQVDSKASIGPLCIVEAECVVGANTRLESHVVLAMGTIIGKNCRVGSHTVVGQAGFGIEHDEDGLPFRIPHRGGVRIGDNVQIGGLVSIAQGTMAPTVINDYVMIDDHVFIAHNVQIGKGAMVIAGAEVSGSVRIGEGAWIAPQATIRNGLVIGSNATVGIGAVVVKDVPDGETVMGNPARPRAR